MRQAAHGGTWEGHVRLSQACSVGIPASGSYQHSPAFPGLRICLISAFPGLRIWPLSFFMIRYLRSNPQLIRGMAQPLLIRGMAQPLLICATPEVLMAKRGCERVCDEG